MLYQKFKTFSCYILECFILDKAFLLGLSRILLVIIFDGRKRVASVGGAFSFVMSISFWSLRRTKGSNNGKFIFGIYFLLMTKK